MEKILVVCAHPDDETLGIGGTLALHAAKKDEISILIMTDGETSRRENIGIKSRQQQAINACKILGITDIEFLSFEDQKLDTIPLLELNKKIEMKMKKVNPTILYTHFWGDLNKDHRCVFESVAVASRPLKNKKLKKFICFETPSSTDYTIGDETYKPNLFVDIENVLSKKLEALSNYKNEINEYPHPRSIDAVKNRSGYWGSVCGLKSAEALIIYREIS